jgi:hypothetical protein
MRALVSFAPCSLALAWCRSLLHACVWSSPACSTVVVNGSTRLDIVASECHRRLFCHYRLVKRSSQFNGLQNQRMYFPSSLLLFALPVSTPLCFDSRRTKLRFNVPELAPPAFLQQPDIKNWVPEVEPPFFEVDGLFPRPNIIRLPTSLAVGKSDVA